MSDNTTPLATKVPLPPSRPPSPPTCKAHRPPLVLNPRAPAPRPASEPPAHSPIGYQYQAPPPYTAIEILSVRAIISARQRYREAELEKSRSSDRKENKPEVLTDTLKEKEIESLSLPRATANKAHKSAQSPPAPSLVSPSVPTAVPPPRRPPVFYFTQGDTFWTRGRMATPPRMLVLTGGGYEAFVALPTSYDKAIQVAMDKFNIPKDTHYVRLSCRAGDMTWIGVFAGQDEVFIADNDSYHYACAGKHVARLGVHVYEKEASKPKEQKAPAATPGSNKSDRGAKASKKDGSQVSDPTASEEVINITTSDGKNVNVAGFVSGDLAKGPPIGSYLGVMSVENGKRSFVGNQLGPNEVFTKYIIHDKTTARLLFRPRSIRPSLEFLHPEEKSLEVNLSVKDWTITSAYPTTSIIPDTSDPKDPRQRLRWFLKVHPSGTIQDLLTGTCSSNIFYEMLPSPVPRPKVSPDPQGPLVPAWPDVRPSNAWCLPQSIFIAHIDRVLETLGLPVESRTSMITGWLPGITRHKNILDPTTTLRIIPPPSVMLRIFILFKGIGDSALKDWENAGILHAEMGLDWRNSVGWTPDLANEDLFRVIEYGAMEVFEM